MESTIWSKASRFRELRLPWPKALVGGWCPSSSSRWSECIGNSRHQFRCGLWHHNGFRNRFILKSPSQHAAIEINIFLGVDGVPPSASFLCQLYFNTTSPVCDGGVVALNGTNGAILWRAWLSDAVSQIRCLADLDLDGIKDCVLLGRTKVSYHSIFSQWPDSSLPLFL